MKWILFNELTANEIEKNYFPIFYVYAFKIIWHQI